MRSTDIFVETSNPAMLDQTVNALGAAVMQDGQGEYLLEGQYYVVRAFGDPGFIEFAIDSQGYGKMHGRREGDD